MFCSKCGSEVPDGATFCGTCGAEMIDVSTMPVATSASQTAVMAAPAGNYPQGGPDGAFAAGGQGGQDWQPQEEPPKKSKKGKVIAIIVLILLLMGIGAGVAWYFTNQFYQDKLAAEESESAKADEVSVEPIESSSVEEDSSSSSTSSSSSSSSVESPSASTTSSSGPSATADASADADSYVGTWTGEMVSTKTGSSYNCYGATGNPMELTITDNASTGQITADVKFLLHAHAMSELTSDVEKHDADKMLELKGLVGTFNNGSFSFNREIEDSYANGKVEFDIKTSEKNGERVLVCEVKRRGLYGSDVITDTYELKKKKA